MRLSELDKKGQEKELRLAIQSGELSKSQGFALRGKFKKVIEKYAKGDSWEIKQQFLDTGLYYNGTDAMEATKAGMDIIGALYGYFQDGARRTVTRVVKTEDNNIMSFDVMPSKKPGEDRPASQITFALHKNISQGGPVIGINVSNVKS